MSHQRRRPFFVLSKNTRWQRGSAQRRTRDSSPRIERVGRGFDDGDDESGERVADWNERANERAVGAQIDAARAGAAAEHAIDLR